MRIQTIELNDALDNGDIKTSKVFNRFNKKDFV